MKVLQQLEVKQAQSGLGDVRDARDRRLSDANVFDAARKAKLLASAGGGDGKGKKASAPFDPEGDLQFQLDEAARKRTRDLLISRDTEADKAREDSAKRLNDLIASTPTGQLEKAREEAVFLAKSLKDGYITETQYLEAVSLHYGTATEKLSGMDEFASEAARGIQSAFADFLFDPFEGGIKGMLDSFGRMLQRMAAEAAAAQLSRALFGDFGTTGKIGGFIGNAALSFFGGGSTGSPVGNNPDEWGPPGGYAEGSRYIPNDQVAMLHKGERVLTASENSRTGNARAMTVVNNFHLSAPADRRTQEQVAAMAGASIQTAMRRNR